MRPDVIDLREFYSTPVGQLARRHLQQRIRAIWPNVVDQRLLGLGFATPYLRLFKDEAERVLALMPAAQGVIHWPPEGPSLTGLVEEGELPLPDASIDRVLLVHELENSEQIGQTLREIWRVLAPGGRLLVVAPNRRGLWARFEHTPFGHGHPFTGSQLTRLLREGMFLPTRTESALYWPPSHWRFLLRAAGPLERLGERYRLRFAGVLLVEAGKQIYAATPERGRVRHRRFGSALQVRPAIGPARTMRP